jgi:hypothetical protein
MTIADTYQIPGTPKTWEVPQDFANCFNWEFAPERARLLNLYERGKTMQWNANDRIDWSQELDPENPQQLPPEMLPISGTPVFQRMSPKEQAEIRRHHQAWSTSQFLQGEQGALICAAKIVQQVPDMDAKFYAATQVMDEARHVEVYKKLIAKFGIAYPMTKPLQELLDQVLRDSRWDMTYLGMQVVIEGLALAAFARIRDHAQNPLAAAVNAYVMEDEARHVAFGRLSLRDYYPQLTQAERNEREEFLVEACYLMRDRFDAMELWQNLGLPMQECVEFLRDSGYMAMFRKNLFTRIVPTVKDVGLWGEKVRRGYEQMGVLQFSEVDIEAVQEDDQKIARDFDARRKHVEEVIAAGA